MPGEILVPHVQDLSITAAMLADSPFAFRKRPPENTGPRPTFIKYRNVKYNPRQDRFLRQPADDILERHAKILSVDEPTCEECGGAVRGGEDGNLRKCVDVISIERTAELIALMKPLGDKSGNGLQRSRK